MQIFLEVGPLAMALSLRLCCQGLATSFLMRAAPSTGPASFRQRLRSALSIAMREVLPFINIMSELKICFCPRRQTSLSFFCTVWNDIRSCIKVALSPKFTPRTKHIVLKYHHFMQIVLKKTVRIKSKDTLEQNADIFTKPFGDGKVVRLRKKVCGW